MKPTILVIVMAVMIAPHTEADMIIFEHESVSFVTGSIGNTQFNAPFVITAVGDTDDREMTNAGWRIDHSFASITIENIGTFEFITPTRTAVSNLTESISFNRLDPELSLFVGPTHPELRDWDMTTSIGPLTNNDGFLTQWTNEPVETTGGILAFDIADDMRVTFTATVIPAPAALAFFGIAGFAARRRRRSQ